MTDRYEQQAHEPTAADLSDELRALGVDEALIATAFQNALQRRAEIERTNQWDAQVLSFATAYRRVAPEEPNDSNIEGWYERLQDDAMALLDIAGRQSERSELQDKVLHTAAATYFYLQAERENEVDVSLIQRSGVNVAALHAHMQAGLSGVLNPGGDQVKQQAIDQATGTVELLATRWGSYPDLWARTVTPLADQLCDDLIANGVTLPSLGPDGKYPEENEDV